jgi:hypothetical protein
MGSIALASLGAKNLISRFINSATRLSLWYNILKIITWEVSKDYRVTMEL